MKNVSSAYLDSGRREQKRRTRDALIDAARALVAEGVSPTVEQAAAAAGISRTTAYRYFTNQQSLLLAAHPETGQRSLLPDDTPSDAASRLEAVATIFTDLISSTEPQQRTMLRLSLSQTAAADGLPLRQGRAIGWLTEALAPLEGELTWDQIHQLVLAIRSAIGIESRVWLTDVAGLPAPDAVALQRWVARSLLRAVKDELPPFPSRPGNLREGRRHP